MFRKNLSTIIEVMPQRLWNLEEVKNYLRISNNHDDHLISEVIAAAITAAENFTSLTLTPKRINYTCNLKNVKKFYLQYKPVDEIIKIVLVKNGQELELKQQQYNLDRQRWIIYLAKMLSTEELVVEYIAGFRPEIVPPAIKHGILLHIAEMYDREQVDNVMFSLEVKNLYLSYRQLKI